MNPNQPTGQPADPNATSPQAPQPVGPVVLPSQPVAQPVPAALPAQPVAATQQPPYSPTIAETEAMLQQKRQQQTTPQQQPATTPMQPPAPSAAPEENLPFAERFTVPKQTPQPIAPTEQPQQEPQQDAPFDPRKVAAYASSTPINPITAAYTPAPGTHIPEDIAARIGETPMQSSSDILKEGKHGLSSARLKSLLTFVVFIASIFVAAFLINQFIFQSYYVEGTSMTPTLQNNDRLIISKVERSFSAVQGKPYIPDRGQIVILDSSIVGINGQKEQLIKRVIGLPGERVKINNGVVTVVNQQHPDGFDVTKTLGLTNLDATYTEAPVDVIIPQGQVYVMGDNRKQGGSYDSRAFGPISGDKIQGRLWARVLPIEQARLY